MDNTEHIIQELKSEKWEMAQEIERLRTGNRLHLELAEIQNAEIERLREALQKIYWATKEPEIDRIAGAALQQKDSE